MSEVVRLVFKRKATIGSFFDEAMKANGWRFVRRGFWRRWEEWERP